MIAIRAARVVLPGPPYWLPKTMVVMPRTSLADSDQDNPRSGGLHTLAPETGMRHGPDAVHKKRAGEPPVARHGRLRIVLGVVAFAGVALLVLIVVARRPDFPIKIGLYSFSNDVEVLQPIQPYNREQVRGALTLLRRPRGGTAIGDAMREARPDLYRAGVFRKYILVVTDGENTNGREPDEVDRYILV